jgi:modulator of FtsH protease
MLHHQMATFLGFLLVGFGLMAAISYFRNSATGVLLLLLFTGIMGAYSSLTLSFVLHSPDGASLVALAFGATALIFAVMATTATFIKGTLQGFGKFLFVGLILLLVAMFANVFFQLPALYVTLLVLSVALFSGYLLFDLNRIMKRGETNYVMATLSLYLDLFNIFMSILDLLGIFDSRL